MNVMEDPLVGPPPAEVPLKEAPLVRVIAQVRFPLILAIEQREFVAPFQESLRATYPVLREEPGQELLFGEAGIAVQVKPQVDEIGQLVRPEVRGFLGTAAAEHVVHSISQSAFAVDEARVIARWGQLPANATVDVSAIEPVAEKSWILDLDMSREAPMTFEADRIAAEAKGFAERIYKIFRWAVSEEFLRRYGGGLS